MTENRSAQVRLVVQANLPENLFINSKHLRVRNESTCTGREQKIKNWNNCIKRLSKCMNWIRIK